MSESDRNRSASEQSGPDRTGSGTDPALSGAPVTVLLVDDEPNNRLVFRLALQDAFDVVVAATGEEALLEVSRRKVDIIFTDHRMPGMSGVELCGKLKAVCPSVPRVLLTAHPFDPVVQAAFLEGTVMELVAKPWERGKVVDLATRLLQAAAKLV